MRRVALLLFVLLVAPVLAQGVKTPALLLWVKADDLAAVCKPGDRVSVWPDASGGGADLKAEGEGRPTFLVEQGRPLVRFAGDLRTTPKTVQAFTVPLMGEWKGMTFFAVGAHLGVPGLLDTAPGGNGCLRTMGWLQMCGTSANLPGTFPALDGMPGLGVGTISGGIDADNVYRVTTYVNGMAQGTSEAKAPLYGTIFHNAHLGTNNVGETAFRGDLCEVLLYHGVLSDTDRAKVERYLLVKYGLATAQPGDPKLPVGYTPPKPTAQLPPPPPVKSVPAKAGLLLWARAEEIAGVAEGATVARWPAAVGGELTAELGHRPAYLARGLNNRPVVRFDGDGAVNPKIVHYFTLPLTGEHPEITVLVAGTNLGRAGVVDTAPGRNECLRTCGFLQLCGSKLDGGSPFADLQYAPGAGMIAVTVGKLGEQGQYLATYADGHRQLRSETPDARVPVLFQNPTIGTNNLGETQFNGLIGEVLIYDHALTDTERAQTEAYLAEKYAIPIRTDAELAKIKNARSRWTLTQPHLPAAQSWFGNTFSGKTQWVQSGISGLTALPDGTAVATSVWDEPHKEIGYYKDGKPVGERISGGCSGVTFDDTYLYVGDSGMGKNYAGVRRHTRDGKEAPWPALGDAKWIRFDTDAPWHEVNGLATDGKTLYVTAIGLTAIRVYDAATGALRHTLPIAQSGPLALAKDGTLWLANDAGVTQLTASGAPTGKTIPGVTVGALAVDPQGHLVAAVNGTRNQVVRYDVSGAQPKEIGALGDAGGVFAGPRRGAMGDTRLPVVTGLGIDAAGNVYCNTGSLLRSYTPEGKLRWELQCTVFCTCSDFDPATDGADIYDHRYHYRNVPGAPAGQDWRWVGVTADPGRFPEMAEGRGQNAVLRRLNGRLYRYTWGESVTIHRQEADSEIFVPCAMYYANEYRASWRPAAAPAKGRFIWTDLNGDGQADKGEFTQPAPDATPSHESFNYYVDDRGGIWEPEDRWGVRYLPLKGFTPAGAPLYDFAAHVWYARPAEFIQVLRVLYFPATDTMYLSGLTWDHPVTGHEYGWGCCGHELICYDNWTKPTRKLRCRMPFPDGAEDIKALTVCDTGNRAFVGEMEGNVLFVYDTKTGKYLGIIEPDATLFGGVGWIDIDAGVRVFQRKSGELVLLDEDSYAQKQMVYRVGK